MTSSESGPDVKFEIGHVLYIDIVGYSKLLINEQSDQIQKLKAIVRATEQVGLAEAEGKLLRLPTGDGGALVFRNSPEAPVRCALEIAKELKQHPELQVRMGIHSGPVNEVVDLNEQANIAGAGINVAQRVMDCGDARHIILSKRVAEDLAQYRQWQPLLHDLGEVEVKHGARVHVFNLYTDEIGNAELPEKFRRGETVRADEGFWVAVLPFKYNGSNADLTALAEGLTEEIVTGLSRFSYLKVTSRSSTLRYANESVDVRSAGKNLGARYVMEGSLRQAGTKLRLAVQLVDAVSGAHLWAENYERAFSPEAIFELQDDLVPRIVSTVADRYGILCYNMSDLVRSKNPNQLTPYEALLRCIGYGYRLTPEEHATARTCMERGVQQAPSYADGWAILSLMYSDEYGFGFNEQPDPLGRALEAARRATDAGPSNSLSHAALAKTLFFRKEFPAFRTAAEHAVSINSVDGAQLAMMGSILAYSGDWERGCALVERAMQLNPRYPAWYWFPFFYNAYRKGDYVGALNVAIKINLPGFFAVYEVLAAVYGQLGHWDAASQNLKEMLKLIPNFGEIARALKSKWFDSELVEHLLDGLRKAGLEIPGDDKTLPAAGKSSGKNLAQEAFWVAVLPFKSSGGAEIESFADGLSEDITTGLSRFPYLSVVAKAAAARLKGRIGDERTLGAELGARYVLEGSIRKQSSTIRVSARLIDTESGAQLWAETYDRDLEVSSIFAVQDDVASRIVATVADSYGVLVNSMTSLAEQKDDVDLTPAEWQFQYFAYRQQITPANHAALKKRLEAALERDQRRAEIWSCLAQMYVDAYAFGFQADPNDLDRALDAARRGVEFDRTNQFGLVSLAQTYFFRQDLAAFRPAAERAMALNPLNTDALGILGLLIVHTGEFERGGAIVRRAMELNPDHAGWMHFGPIWEHFHKGDYERALDHANQVDIPGLFWPYLVVASTCGHLGRHAQAKAAVRDLLALDPEFATHARSNIASWHFASGLLEPLLDGLRKAGLSIPESKLASEK